MNYRDYVIKRLKSFKEKDIILTTHTLLRIAQRQIDKREVIENIINPKRLEYAIKEGAFNSEEEKFDCYFAYSKTLCHRYVIVIKKNVVVVTIIKINRRWQKFVIKKMKSSKYSLRRG